MAPAVEGYAFGRMVIDGKTYTSDLKVVRGGIVAGWWRREGHLLVAEDVKDIMDAEPEVFVVGQGAFCVMKIAPELELELKQAGIRLVAGSTPTAVERYNELVASGARGVCAAFHLTC